MSNGEIHSGSLTRAIVAAFYYYLFLFFTAVKVLKIYLWVVQKHIYYSNEVPS